MNIRKISSSILLFFLRIFCRPQLNKSLPENPKRFLIIRQHNQFGDMLATIPLFRAVKEKYPGSHITLIASPENYFAVTKNKYIDTVFNFDKKLIWDTDFIKAFWQILRKGYDVVIMPATVSISTTSCLMARMAKSDYSIGPKSLNGMENKLCFLFNNALDLDWRENPELNVSRFCLAILKPLNITTGNFASHVSFDDSDLLKAEQFLNSFGDVKSELLIGFHVGAGKPPNRWPVERYVELIDKLKLEFGIKIFFTGSESDRHEINEMKKHFNNSAGYFLNRTIPELAALISLSRLFITNDTGVMHVAGAVTIPQISLFGPTNPNNWAPVGENKYVIKKSDSINSITVEDVYSMAKEIMTKGER